MTPIRTTNTATSISELRRDAWHQVAQWVGDDWRYDLPKPLLHAMRDDGKVLTVTGRIDGGLVTFAKLARR